MIGEFIQGDCMIGMKDFPDNHFDLAIVDPPYGIGSPNHEKKTQKLYSNKSSWNNTIPSQKYFDELKRVSKNRIIWGGNYYTDSLPATASWICWDKCIPGEPNGFSKVELAWTSLNIRTSLVKKRVHQDNKIHPTQKPIAIYKWLLKNYAKEGDLILDTHVGSASSLIACEDMGFKYVGFELDEDYYKAASKRLEDHISQLKLQF